VVNCFVRLDFSTYFYTAGNNILKRNKLIIFYRNGRWNELENAEFVALEVLRRNKNQLNQVVG